MNTDEIIAKFGGKYVDQPADDVDAIISKFGGKYVSASGRPNAAPINVGAQNFRDAMKEELANADPFKKAIAAFGVGASDLVERVKQMFGKEDRATIEANKMIAADQSVAAIAGDVAMTAIPLAKLMPVYGGAVGGGAKALQYAKNVGVGAGAGAALSQLRPDAGLNEAVQGAGMGAFGAGVVAPAANQLLKGAGYLWDTMRGNRSSVDAARILKDAAGDKFDEMRAAMRNAPDDLTAAQAGFDLDRDVWSALGEFAKRGDKDSFYRLLADSQKAADRARVVAQTGGDTQTAARASRIADKDALTEQFVPRMERELVQANRGGQAQRVQTRYQAQADELGDAAAARVNDARKMYSDPESARVGVIDRAKELNPRLGFRDMSGNPTGYPGSNGRHTYGQELAGRAEREASNAASESLILGEGRRFSQKIADMIERFGQKPLNVDPILKGIRGRINNVNAAGNDDYARVLSKVSDDIQEWTAKNGGVIDSRALYAIRKNSVNDAIGKLTGKTDPKAAAKFEAEVLSGLKPMIDDAIEAAGGKNWRSTLKFFESGMKEINQKKMGAELLDQFDKSPKTFVETVSGGAPEKVEKIFNFGKDAYDIDKMMGDKIIPLKSVASNLDRDTKLAERAAGASNALAQILEKDTMKFRLPGLLNWKATVGNKALDELEGKINRQTMEKITNAMKSGKNAEEAMSFLPAKERDNMLKVLMQYAPYGSIQASTERPR